jgi:hypothetical protein
VFSAMKSAGEDTAKAIPDATFSAMKSTQEEFTVALTEAKFSGIKSNEEETAKAATDATFSAMQSTEEKTTKAATDATFSRTKTTEEETLDGQVDEEDKNVAPAVSEKVSLAPYKKVITIGPTSDSVLKLMKESFYRVYSEHFETVRVGGTTVLTRELYDHKVQLLIDAASERYKGRTKPQEMQNALNRFTLLGQVQGSQLYCQTKGGHPTRVPYYEILFDIIHKAHLFLAHAKDRRVTKVHLDGHWSGVRIFTA